MQFEKLTVSNWRQFNSVDLDLNTQTTILTGTNGCGKTTLLNLLSRHFGWNINFVSTPFMSKRLGKLVFSEFFKRKKQESDPDITNQQTAIGYIQYSNGVSANISVPPTNTNQYQVTINQQQHVTGLHIPSHRPAAVHQAVQNIPINPKTYHQHYHEFLNVLQQSYNSHTAQNRKNPGTVLKESLISLAVFGQGNDSVKGNEEYRWMFHRFQQVLADVLPETIGFQKIEIRMPDVVLVTESGDFSLDAMSGGINALLGIVWQILMSNVGDQVNTVIIDEPENHLHPRMQRTLLPSLERAFPNSRFVIATHSPFIVTSNPNAAVYGLVNSETGGIISSKLTDVQLASTPDTILREVLDVPSTSPVWVENKVKEILKKYKDVEPTAETAKSIYSELSEFGLTESLADFGFSSTRD